MQNRSTFIRGVVVGVLLMMVVRSVVWLLTPGEHPDATAVRYGLNVMNILICGATAWSTARMNEQLAGKLHQILVGVRHLPIGRR